MVYRLTYHQLSWGYVSVILQKIYWRAWMKRSSNSLNSKISWFWGQTFAHQLSEKKNVTTTAANGQDTIAGCLQEGANDYIQFLGILLQTWRRLRKRKVLKWTWKASRWEAKTFGSSSVFFVDGVYLNSSTMPWSELQNTKQNWSSHRAGNMMEAFWNFCKKFQIDTLFWKGDFNHQLSLFFDPLPPCQSFFLWDTHILPAFLGVHRKPFDKKELLQRVRNQQKISNKERENCQAQRLGRQRNSEDCAFLGHFFGIYPAKRTVMTCCPMANNDYS